VCANPRDHQQNDVDQRQYERKAEHAGDAARVMPGRGLEMRVTVGVGMHNSSLRSTARLLQVAHPDSARLPMPFLNFSRNCMSLQYGDDYTRTPHFCAFLFVVLMFIGYVHGLCSWGYVHGAMFMGLCS
jgi:hypothetical protein